jgi:hypothetical protein
VPSKLVLKKKLKECGDEEEDVRSYWVSLRERGDTGS